MILRDDEFTADDVLHDHHDFGFRLINRQCNVFTRFQGYTVLKSVFSSTVSQMQSGLLCSSFFCVTLLREALVYFTVLSVKL